MQKDREFKIVIIGDKGVGKTSFIHRYMHNMNVKADNNDVYHLTFVTNHGTYKINIWETNNEIHYLSCDAAFIMFDFTNIKSYENAQNLIDSFKKIEKSSPVLLLGNKIDSKMCVMNMSDVNIHRKNMVQFYPISVKSGYNMLKPFTYILEKLTRLKNFEINMFPTN